MLPAIAAGRSRLVAAEEIRHLQGKSYLPGHSGAQPDDNERLKTYFTTLLTGFCWLAGLLTLMAAPVSVLVDAQLNGLPIAPAFTGLSFETAQLLPDRAGVHYFRPDNAPLVQLFHTLGIRSLRLGGSSSDRPAIQLPANADLDSLFAFARAADVKIIYGLRLHGGDPDDAAQTVKYLMAHYSEQIDCFALGEEPAAYPGAIAPAGPGRPPANASYANYADTWRKFEIAITAMVPGVKLCGPSEHQPAWPPQFIKDFSHGHNVALITGHLYPGGDDANVPSPEIGGDRLLSPHFARTYENFYQALVPLAASNGLPCRLDEVNHFFDGGATNVSNTFAAALWGLDFMYWWAAHGVAGVNFHTGDPGPAGNELSPATSAAFITATNGFRLRPLAYGIKAFALGSHGNLLPAMITNSEHLNLSIYAVKDDVGHLSLTLINKEHGAQARSATVSIDEAHAFSGRGRLMQLAAPGQNLAATTGETLGNGTITAAGNWSGNWTLVEPSSTGTFTVEVPASTAVILKLSAN